jgi:hypothetical protein
VELDGATLAVSADCWLVEAVGVTPVESVGVADVAAVCDESDAVGVSSARAGLTTALNNITNATPAASV